MGQYSKAFLLTCVTYLLKMSFLNDLECRARQIGSCLGVTALSSGSNIVCSWAAEKNQFFIWPWVAEKTFLYRACLQKEDSMNLGMECFRFKENRHKRDTKGLG